MNTASTIDVSALEVNEQRGTLLSEPEGSKRVASMCIDQVSHVAAATNDADVSFTSVDTSQLLETAINFPID